LVADAMTPYSVTYRTGGTSMPGGYGIFPPLPPIPPYTGAGSAPGPRGGGSGAPPEATTGPGGGGGPGGMPPRPPNVGFARYASTAVSSTSVMLDTGRIVPLPPVTAARVASSPSRLVMSTSVGARAPGTPCRSAP